MTFLVAHLNPDENWSLQERFDTLISPCGTVATLGKILKNIAPEQERYLFDGWFPGNKMVQESMRGRIREALRAWSHPHVFFSLLLYNSGPTIQMIQELKREFWDKITTTIWWQLVPYVSSALVKNHSIDHVAIGDGEALIPALMKKGVPKLLNATQENRLFAGVDYTNFFEIQERLEKQREESGFTQLTAQWPGWPWCSWAANNPSWACSFCALQNITIMNETPLKDSLLVEKELQDQFGVDRIFDVANQFLPFLRKEDIMNWLQSYHSIRQSLWISVKKYAYVTVQSIIDSEIVSMLAQVGVTEVYVGIDHFDAASLREQNKSHRSWSNLIKALNNLRNNGITFRCGLVLGSSSETESSFASVSDWVDMLLSYENLRAIGIFPLEVLPGSRIYSQMKQECLGTNIIAELESKWFLDREQQKELSRIWIDHTSPIWYQRVVSFRDELQWKINQSRQFTYTLDKYSGI